MNQLVRIIQRYVVLLMLTLVGCTTPPAVSPPEQPSAKPTVPPVVTVPAKPVPDTEPPDPVVPAEPGAVYTKASWSDLPGWARDNPAQAWVALLRSCVVLSKRDEAWRDVCAQAAALKKPRREFARRFFESAFTPYQIADADGATQGLITGYYEPLLKGSRKRSARYQYAVYGVPDDLLVIDFADLYPELKGMRLRGRIEGRRVVPYYDRAQIENGAAPVRGREIAWVDDPIDLFFLQIQGSGRIQLDNGETMRVGYANQNGHKYRSIGRVLIARGDLPLEKTSMQGIKAWIQRNPARMTELLNQNASYVFFRELPGGQDGPPGALGVPLSARRSVAVDRRYVPLGAPVFLATTWPNSARPLNRLMLAQDTGGAIRGAVRADFFWGFGADATREAGRMKQSLRMWVLLPNGLQPPDATR
jgi:membrane-bound lytic murein transglycosylase A